MNELDVIVEPVQKVYEHLSGPWHNGDVVLLVRAIERQDFRDLFLHDDYEWCVPERERPILNKAARLAGFRVRWRDSGECLGFKPRRDKL